jgi:ribosomal protein S18 acetylase RimI-like enzyme
MPISEYAAVEQNLRAAMQFFGRASGCGAVEEREGILMIDSGVNYAVFNIAMLTTPVANLQQLDRRVATASSWFAERRTRWSQWICDDHVPANQRRGVADVFYRHHLRPLTEAPGMLAPALRPPDRALPVIRWRRVDDAQTRVEFAHLTTVCFDIPFVTAQMIYQPEAAWRGDYQGYIGYVNNKAISMLATVAAADSIGIYSVGTLPEMRRHGYAEILMRNVVDDVRKRTGLSRIVLQATRAGYPMYRKLGFRETTRFNVYLS